MQCQHYDRLYLIQAPCCSKMYTCRFCHDESENHPIDRFKIENIQCKECKTIQPFGIQCVQCEKHLGEYICHICHIIDTKEKEIFHCDKCGICRVGGKDNYIHCDTCNMCLKNECYNDHICIENSLNRGCPICQEDLFTSINKTTIFKCGHSMHCECYQEYIKHDYRCPTCRKTLVGDVLWKQLDLLREMDRMPEEFANTTNKILCQDCQEQSTVPFHFQFNKCTECGSYNTIVEETLNHPLNPS